MATLRNRKTTAAAPMDKAMHNGQPFTVKATAGFAGFNQGDTLSTDRHIAAYFRAVLEEDGEVTLSDAEILSTVKATNVEGLSDDEADIARTDALTVLQESKATPLVDQRSIAIVAASDPSGMLATAIRLGEMVAIGSAFDNQAIAAIDGKKTWDAAPLVMAADGGSLETMYGKETLRTLPIVGTRKQGKINKAGVATDNVPESYNLPTDYFKIDGSKTEDGKPLYPRFVTLWVHNMPHVKQWIARKETCTKLKKNDATLLQGIANGTIVLPADIASCMHNGVVDTPKMEALEKDVQSEITNYTTRATNALACWQARDRIEREFSDNIQVGYVDGTAEASARRKNPILIEARTGVTSNGQPKWTGQQPPLSISAFTRLKFNEAKILAGNSKEGVTWAHIREASKRTPKKPNANVPQPNAQNSEAKAKRIDNAALLGDVLFSVADYVENNAELLRSAASKQGDDGAMTCYRIVQAYDLLRKFGTDDAIRTRAKAYDQQQLNANAAADAARAEAARVEMETKAKLEKTGS